MKCKCISSFFNNISNSLPPHGDKICNSLSNVKILDWLRLKAFTDNKINVNEKSKFVLGRVENIVRGRYNAAYQHFLLFQQCLQTAFNTESLKAGIV